MFSIVIPLYNKAPYVDKAIRSVLCQTFREFELIIIDDGSTDNPLPPKGGTVPERLGRFCFPFEKVRIIEQENTGVSTARNNGVKLAKYEYIAFLDADDWWEPTYLEEMKTLIEGHPEAGIYGSNYYIVKNKQKRQARLGVDIDFKCGYIDYCKVYAKTCEMPVWTGAAIARKHVFESENGFKPTLKLGEDFDLWVRIALKSPVALLNKPLAFYNQDVNVAARAVVVDRLFEPENHFVFNLDYLDAQEQINIDLKNLLDRLRVYTLLRYRLQRAYSVEVKREINKVDFSRQPLSVRMNYLLPVVLLKFIYDLRKIGSGLLKYIRK